MNFFENSWRYSQVKVSKFATSFASVVVGVNDTSDKISAGVNDTGGDFPPASTTPVANLPPVSMTPVANNGNNIRLLGP